MRAKPVDVLLLCSTILALITGCASSQSTRSEAQREEDRRRAIRATHTIGYPVVRPGGSDQ
jgi:hypothetical protein